MIVSMFMPLLLNNYYTHKFWIINKKDVYSVYLLLFLIILFNELLFWEKIHPCFGKRLLK